MASLQNLALLSVSPTTMRNVCRNARKSIFVNGLMAFYGAMWSKEDLHLLENNLFRTEEGRDVHLT